ncbi:MAG: hypothetical protein ACI883_000363 [Candidatus Azotimanducaceae bacterium]|jgi:hypothetical protein|tara:strand:- start:10056 stop:10193 length:138 start_codon:yes stop_codon:yes gene_type:complete
MNAKAYFHQYCSAEREKAVAVFADVVVNLATLVCDLSALRLLQLR